MVPLEERARRGLLERGLKADHPCSHTGCAKRCPRPGRVPAWSSKPGPGNSRAETIRPGEISNTVGYPAGFVVENGPIPACNLSQCCSGTLRIVTLTACQHPPVTGTGIVINETPIGSREYYGKPSRLSRSPGIVSTKNRPTQIFGTPSSSSGSLTL